MDALVSDPYARSHPSPLIDSLGPAIADLAGRCRSPAASHVIHSLLAYLDTACDYRSPTLFLDYLQWSRQIRARQSLPPQELHAVLAGLEQWVRRICPDNSMALSLLLQGQRILSEPDGISPAPLSAHAPHGPLARQCLQSLLRCDIAQATQLIETALGDGISIHDLYLNVFQTCLREVGRLWQHNHVSIAQEHYVSAAIQTIMSRLYPRIFLGPRTDRHLLAACVDGELHEIGIRMVADLFELAGWRTTYIGAATPGQDLVRMVRDLRPDVVALSVTMSGYLDHAGDIVAMIRRQPDLSACRILVGGYPLSLDPDLWRRLGADGTAADAAQAVITAERLLAERP